MEMELEPRVKSLPYKVKAMSRESPAQKAAHVLDSDLRTHWSTATNTKEWILLELDEACLLSHIRIYNKSVLEWEITVGLRYKPDTFVKVRSRCEAPRRDMLYPMNYTPCRYVRISCLRGNPIAIFFIQLIGVPVSGLEPEFQPVVNYLLPHIIANKQDTHDMHLQLLQDITKRLQFFLPQLEADLMSFTDAADSNIRFLALLAGPLYPILHIAHEREAPKTALNPPDLDALRNNPISTLTVSSNFEAQPRRSRSPLPFVQHSLSSIPFRPDAVVMLLRKAYKDPHLGIVCRTASIALQKLVDPAMFAEESTPSSELILSSTSDEIAKSEVPGLVHLADYSSLFGEEFRIPVDNWDSAYLNILDIAAVEEGILHTLYACASQPLLCCKLSNSNSDFLSVLPLVQALLPALRPLNSSPDQVDDIFCQWKQPYVQHALSQIVTMTSSSVYHPLLHACAGYLSSFSSSHVKAACMLIDLCSGPFSPWISKIVAKVDLAIELVEDLLGIIQGARQSVIRSRAALKYIILALSGHIDDILSAYKEAKHKLLFLIDMLETFLDPALSAMKSTISFGDVPAAFSEKQERNCCIALNVIRIAVQKPAILPSLESEWRCGSVAPSVLLSILGPHMPLPLDIDQCKPSVSEVVDHEPCTATSGSSIHLHGIYSKLSTPGEPDTKIDASDVVINTDVFEDANYLFAPAELKKLVLTHPVSCFTGNGREKNNLEYNKDSPEDTHLSKNLSNDHFLLDNNFAVDYINLEADYLQVVSQTDCEFRASEFHRLALDLFSQPDITLESHDAAIDALLLAAECYVNPFFMISFRPTSKVTNQMNNIKNKINQNSNFMEFDPNFRKRTVDLETVAQLERKRDKTVLQILLQAAKMDFDYKTKTSQGWPYQDGSEDNDLEIDISPNDIQSADAVTLVRNNQALLCHFVMLQLQRAEHSSHEILLQSLLFLLHSATELFCPPENVIDIILQSAENLNVSLTSLYHQLQAGNIQLDPEKLHGLKRHWVILQNLVIASSGTNDGISNMKNGFQYRTLIPPSSWMHKISKLSKCPYPLPRFLGWMAVSRYAKQYLKERLFLASDLSHLSLLLSIFSDDLALVDNIINQKTETSHLECNNNQYLQVNNKVGHSDNAGVLESYRVLYPDMHKFFPNMKTQFGSFGEIILESVGLHLKCLPYSVVPDMLCWFADLCLWPYPEMMDRPSVSNAASHLKGYTATNAKVVILYILESIIREHMEGILPEMLRIAHILISLCKASYCDVGFLDSVMCLLRPLISYFLRSGSDVGKQITDVPLYLDFEQSFEEVFDSIRRRKEFLDDTGGKVFQGSLMIFILGTLFPYLSFDRKREALESLTLWVDFTSSEPTSYFYNYLCAFQKLIDNCIMIIVQNLKSVGISIPDEKLQLSDAASTPSLDQSSNLSSVFPASVDNSSTAPFRDFEWIKDGSDLSNHHVQCFTPDEVNEFSDRLELFISNLIPAIEMSWKLHHQLTKRLTFESAKCILFSKCLSSTIQEDAMVDADGALCLSVSSEIIPNDSKHWKNALKGLAQSILTAQHNSCWQVASTMLDYILTLPQNLPLDYVVGSICYAIRHFCCHAPRISWRLQTDKWLSYLFMRGVCNLDGNEASLNELLAAMLGNVEPEQRSIALQILGRIVGLDTNDGATRLCYTVCQNMVGLNPAISVHESVIDILVSNTWDAVAELAFSDSSMVLRTHAMALLSGYIPFAGQTQLQSFLVASNTLFQNMGKLPHSIDEGHLTQLSLSVLANACLYSPVEDITLIPENVWRNLESMGMSRAGALDDMEKKMCLALCRLRTEDNNAREALKDVFSSNPDEKQTDPKFQSTRETILQVLSSLTSVQSYFDFFSKKFDKECQELEEAEIEMDLLQREKALQEVSCSSQEETVMPSVISFHKKDDNRLLQIQDGIRAIERSKLREEIIVQRQKKLLMRRARQKYLEEVAAREAELLQELDRERATQLEFEVERQRQLELERAKTRELQFNLDMEKERQTQKELQLELEQVESGVRPSRREYSSNPNSRPRDRYRERENGRPGHEGGLLTSSRGRDGGPANMATSGNTLASAPTVMLAGSRSFSGQLPTILQSRERLDDRGSGYEEMVEGSRDSGDGGSIGDPELASAFDGLPGGFGSTSRHGSRSSKSRQIVERRERDGRREGKWERKHS